MRRSGILVNISLALLLLDLVAIGIGATLPDLYLRPLILVILCVSVLLTGRSTIAILIATGLCAAAFVEVFQMLGGHLRFIALGTAAYYLTYSAAFIVRGGPIRARGILGFGLVTLYAILMFFWLDPYGFLRLPSIVYTGVLILFIGLGLRPLLQSGPDKSAVWMAIAVVALLISDSLRAISIFKMPIPELFTLAFYWVGQFSLVRSASFFVENRNHT
ncbi:MAG: lysoplasmalogenase [Spirochaetia bacterium]|nr:lysoplasmalogenase [Spirochaetia bacterium]